MKLLKVVSDQNLKQFHGIHFPLCHFPSYSNHNDSKVADTAIYKGLKRKGNV